MDLPSATLQRTDMTAVWFQNDDITDTDHAGQLFRRNGTGQKTEPFFFFFQRIDRVDSPLLAELRYNRVQLGKISPVTVQNRCGCRKIFFEILSGLYREFYFDLSGREK